MKQINGSSSNGMNKNPFSSLAVVKFAVCFLLLGLAYRLFSSSFVQFVPVATDSDALVLEDALLPPPPPAAAEPPVFNGAVVADGQNQTSQNAKCDLFSGSWVPDLAGPVYTNDTCYTIEEHQNCMKNGRSDTGYLYWRWKPRDCNLAKFDPAEFLDLMRNKSMAFIGDSIMRNHVQSLLCVTSQAEQAVEVYHDKEYKSRRWYYPSYNFTLSVIWSPFLTKATIFEDNDGVSTGITQLHLDELDKVWTAQFENFDYVVTAGGKWFLKTAIYYENNTIVGCHNCNGMNITEVGFEYAYRKALNSTLKFIIGSKHKVYTFFRTTTPDHFENGEWNTGGYCNRTGPFKDGEVDINDVDDIMHRVELEEYEMSSALASKKGLNIMLFDTTSLSLMRPDGHPGAYRHFHPFEGKDKSAKVQNDCLHWCLPGPIDSWNDLMIEILRSG